MTESKDTQGLGWSKRNWRSISAVMAFIAVILIGGTVGAAFARSYAAANPIFLPSILGGEWFEAQSVGGSFTRATDIENAGDERLFVTEQAGLVKILHPDGRMTTFLDLRDRVVVEGAEQGLLAIVFDPDYKTNGSFYVTYTAYNPSENDWFLNLSRFQVLANPDVADQASEKIIYQLGQDFTEHNGGGMAFSPIDGFLYVGLGDDSQFLEAQNPRNRKGKIVQFDLSGDAIENKVFALGLRNPWRFAIDEKNGNIFIGDVGDLEWEEVDLIRFGIEERLNFGWPCVEGPEIRFDDGQCKNPERYRLPEFYYKHETTDAGPRCAVIGGEIYRRQESDPATFLFGDFCTREVWAMTYNSSGVPQVEKLGNLDIPAPLNTFGKGIDGTIYVGLHSSDMPLYKLVIP